MTTPRISRRVSIGAVGAALVLLFGTGLSGAASPGSILKLRNAFIDKYKNRATIENLTFDVDHVGDINPVGSGSDDGDRHVSGRPAPLVGLPMVAELVNAINPGVKDALAVLESVDQHPHSITISGVWRLWFEHPPGGGKMQTQGTAVPKAKDGNPPHCFELHPLTVVDGKPAGASFQPIKGKSGNALDAYPAATAFPHYEGKTFTVRADATFTTIQSTKAVYNYTSFSAKVAGAPFHPTGSDATFVAVDVLNAQGKVVTMASRRLVFADNTAVATALKTAAPKKGSTLKVLGIPRINLDDLISNARAHLGESVTLRGCYEIIVVALLK